MIVAGDRWDAAVVFTVPMSAGTRAKRLAGR
jgi:hypothetical protein